MSHEIQAISIDGPAASGKSTVGKRLADTLGFQFIDSGSLYRATVWGILNTSLEPTPSVIVPLLEKLTQQIELRDGIVFFDGENITSELGKSDVDGLTPIIGSWPETRDAVRKIQRLLSARKPTVMTGRDIGITVLPEAEPKFYITADPEIRAYRRWRQIPKTDRPAIETVFEKIEGRDTQDSHRIHSPMRIPKDAIIIETNKLSVEETTQVLLQHTEKLRYT
jgi:cytidylate kinase